MVTGHAGFVTGSATISAQKTIDIVIPEWGSPLNLQLADVPLPAGGGRLLFAVEINQLPQLLRPAEMTQDVYQEATLWDHGPMLRCSSCC